MYSVVPSPDSTDFLNNGIVSAFQTPSTFQGSAQAALASLGPPTTTATNTTAGSYLPSEVAGAMMGGFDELSDQSSNWQMNSIPVPMRIRAYPGAEYQKTITKGQHLFNSLVTTTADDNMYTQFSVCVLNILHQERAYLEARIEAGERAPSTGSPESVLRNLTAVTPSLFSEMWGYVGPAVEGSQFNSISSEPQWGVAAPGKGRVEMLNIFGSTENPVRQSDELGFIVRLETPQAGSSSNPHAPQPRNIVRIRGYSSHMHPHRMSSKTPVPDATDADSMRYGLRPRVVWRETQINRYAAPGQKFTSIDLMAENELGKLLQKTFEIDYYEHGYIVRVGFATDAFPPNATKDLVEAAHINIGSYQKLPIIGVVPLTRRE